MIHKVFMKALGNPGDYAQVFQNNLAVVQDAQDELRVTGDEATATYPPVSLPVFSLVTLLPDHDEGRCRTAMAAAFKALTGRTLKDYITAYGACRQTSFKAYRKQFLRHYGDVDDFVLLTTFLSAHHKRQEAVMAWLDGQKIPVIEIDILERWKTHVGIQTDPQELITLTRSRIAMGADAQRTIAFEGYLRLIVPLAEHLGRLNAAGEDADAEGAWLAFNAWWALGSLANDPHLVSDFRHFWPAGFNLMMTISDMTGPGGQLLFGNPLAVPWMPGTDLAPIRTLLAEGQWLSSAANVLADWRSAATRVTRMQEALDALSEAQRRAIPRLQRDTLMGYVCASVTPDGAPWSQEALGARGIPPLWLELLAQDLAAFNDGSSPERLVSAVDRLFYYADLLGGWICQLQQGEVCLYEQADDVEGPPDSIAPEHFDLDADLLPPSLCSPLPLVPLASELVARDLQRFTEALGEIQADTQLTLAERLKRISETQQTMAATCDKMLTENVEPLLLVLDELPWEKLSLVPFSTPVSGEQPQESQEGVDEHHEATASAQADMERQQQRVQELEEALQCSEDEARALRASMATLQAHEPEQASAIGHDDLVDAVKAFGQSSQAPEALRLARATYPDRLRILDSAFASASEAASTLSGAGLLRKLLAMAEQGWEAMAAGKPLYSLKEVVPGHLACVESDRVNQHPKLRDERIFTEKTAEGSRRWDMQSHLTLDERHRLYFTWDADALQFVVGHAGRHLSIATAS